MRKESLRPVPEQLLKETKDNDPIQGLRANPPLPKEYKITNGSDDSFISAGWNLIGRQIGDGENSYIYEAEAERLFSDAWQQNLMKAYQNKRDTISLTGAALALNLDANISPFTRYILLFAKNYREIIDSMNLTPREKTYICGELKYAIPESYFEDRQMHMWRESLIYYIHRRVK